MQEHRQDDGQFHWISLASQGLERTVVSYFLANNRQKRIPNLEFWIPSEFDSNLEGSNGRAT